MFADAAPPFAHTSPTVPINSYSSLTARGRKGAMEVFNSLPLDLLYEVSSPFLP